jgi:hypothetical protein
MTKLEEYLIDEMLLMEENSRLFYVYREKGKSLNALNIVRKLKINRYYQADSNPEYKRSLAKMIKYLTLLITFKVISKKDG